MEAFYSVGNTIVLFIVTATLKKIFSDLCGSRKKNRVNVNRTWAFRPVPRPECIEAILHEVGNFQGSLEGGIVCAACYMFRQSALRQNEDCRSNEEIISEVRYCIKQLKGKIDSISDSSNEACDEVALLKTCLYLGGIMLNEQAINLPQLISVLLQQICQIPTFA